MRGVRVGPVVERLSAWRRFDVISRRLRRRLRRPAAAWPGAARRSPRPRGCPRSSWRGWGPTRRPPARSYWYTVEGKRPRPRPPPRRCKTGTSSRRLASVSKASRRWRASAASPIEYQVNVEPRPAPGPRREPSSTSPACLGTVARLDGRRPRRCRKGTPSTWSGAIGRPRGEGLRRTRFNAEPGALRDLELACRSPTPGGSVVRVGRRRDGHRRRPVEAPRCARKGRQRGHRSAW